MRITTQNEATARAAVLTQRHKIIDGVRPMFPAVALVTDSELDTQGHHNGGWMLVLDLGDDGALLELGVGADPDTGKWVAWACIDGDYRDAAPRVPAIEAAIDLVSLAFDAAKAYKEDA